MNAKVHVVGHGCVTVASWSNSMSDPFRQSAHDRRLCAGASVRRALLLRSNEHLDGGFSGQHEANFRLLSNADQ